MTEIRFVIIGCGRIAQRHAFHISQRGKLVAVCDIIPDRADKLAEKYGAISFYELEKVLSGNLKFDVAVICTPNGLHAAHSILCLKAGVHVLCEKPMAINSEDCKEMISASESGHRKLFIVKQNRFNPPVQALKKVLDDGKLGEVYSFSMNCFWNRDASYYSDSWKGTKAMDGGTLYTQFSHFIDLLYWMFGECKTVQACTRNFALKDVIEFEDSGVAILEFMNGTIGTLNYSINAHRKNMEGSLTVIAEKGTIKIGGQYLNELEYQDIDNYVIPDLPGGNPANNYGTYQGSMSNHDKVYDNLVAVLQDGAEISTSSFDGLKTVEMIERIYNSAAQNPETKK